AIEQARVGGHLVLLQILRRRRVERLRLLDGEQLLALLVALLLSFAALAAQVLGKRRTAGEEALEVGLVLGVPGAPLERLPLARIAATRSAPVAHLVDFTPAFLLPRAVVVSHRLSTGFHRITRLRFTGSLREGCQTP